MTPKLRSIRTEIDKIDEELVRLLAARVDAIRAIGACKKNDKDAAILDAPRERVVPKVRWAAGVDRQKAVLR